MKISFISSLVCCILMLSSCHRPQDSKIVSIESLSEVKHDFQDADKQTLVVFDVDETLLMPVDALWQQGRIWEADICKQLPVNDSVKNILKDVRQDDLTVFSNRMLHTQFKRVESNVDVLIKSLQARHIKVIALTNFGPGAFGTIPSLKEWRWAQLSEHKINFEMSFPGLTLTFPDFQPIQSGHPEFYKGILFAANNPKGKVLSAFLDQIAYKPTKIIFIDDKEKYLVSAQEEIAKKGVDFKGFLYSGAHKMASLIDPAIVEFQLKQWKECNEYVCDAQALARQKKFEPQAYV